MMVLDRETQQGPDKASRILEVARGLFSRIGLKNTSIEEIATKAGLDKGLILKTSRILRGLLFLLIQEQASRSYPNDSTEY